MSRPIFNRLTEREANELAMMVTELNGDTEATAKFKARLDRPTPAQTRISTATALMVIITVISVIVVAAYLIITAQPAHGQMTTPVGAASPVLDNHLHLPEAHGPVPQPLIGNCTSAQPELCQ